MSIVFGTSLYGMVDRIPGVCHVRTQFAHLMFFPMIPMRTYLVVEGGRGKSDVAHAMGRSPKSVLFATVRAFLMLGFLVTISLPLERLMGSRPGALPLGTFHIVCGVIGLCCFGLVLASYPLSGPSDERRVYLLRLVEVARRHQAEDAGRTTEPHTAGAHPRERRQPDV